MWIRPGADTRYELCRGSGEKSMHAENGQREKAAEHNSCKNKMLELLCSTLEQQLGKPFMP